MKPEETIDYHVRAVWHAIYRMYNQVASKYDVTTSVGFVLLNIHSEEGTPATKIAPLMGLESRSLTRMLKSMEEKGLIYKQQDELDKRSVRIFLTEKGKEQKEISRQTVRAFNDRVREIIPEQDMQAFFRTMSSVSRLISNS
jgi:DNA-binding MarR family transcriptional regulator